MSHGQRSSTVKIETEDSDILLCHILYYACYIANKYAILGAPIVLLNQRLINLNCVIKCISQDSRSYLARDEEKHTWSLHALILNGGLTRPSVWLWYVSGWAVSQISLLPSYCPQMIPVMGDQYWWPGCSIPVHPSSNVLSCCSAKPLSHLNKISNKDRGKSKRHFNSTLVSLTFQ